MVKVQNIYNEGKEKALECRTEHEASIEMCHHEIEMIKRCHAMCHRAVVISH